MAASFDDKTSPVRRHSGQRWIRLAALAGVALGVVLLERQVQPGTWYPEVVRIATTATAVELQAAAATAVANAPTPVPGAAAPAPAPAAPPTLARDPLGTIWLFGPDGSRKILPDWATYVSYGGSEDQSTVKTVSRTELNARSWAGEVAPKAADGQTGSPGDGSTGLGPGITFGATALPAGSINLAQGRPTQQSDKGGTAGLAVDGNTSGAGVDLSIASASDYQPMPWWQVDLGEQKTISFIQIWPRTDDCCRDRLSNFNVFVSEEQPATDDPYALQATAGVATFAVFGRPGTPTTIEVNGTGRFVRIQMAHPSLLDLAEVQVWSSPAAAGRTTP